MYKKCVYCDKETLNPKFCSKSCSASYNNMKEPKRKITKKCVHCDEVVHKSRSTLCVKHFDEFKNKDYQTKTIGEYRKSLSLQGKHDSWVHAHVRNFARSWLKKLKQQPCAKCGYSLHVELAHIKPLSSFKDEELLSEVNSEKNVIQLCPNCHWEFDNLPREGLFTSLLKDLNKNST